MLAQGKHFRYGRDVAVHAEDRIAHHQLLPVRATGKRVLERRQIHVRIDMYIGAGQSRAVDEACVVQRVGK